MTRTWSVSGRRLMWGQVSGRSGRRLCGRRRGRWKPLVAAPLVGVLLAAGGCSSEGGDDSDVEDVAAASSVDPDTPVEIPVTTEDGRMLQPAGHVGIWFETEPGDPLDRLVWESQQFVGQPLELEPLGDAAWSTAGAYLPDVCDSVVVERMGQIELEKAVDRDFGPEYVLCGASGNLSDSSVRNTGFLWGLGTSAHSFIGKDGVSSLDDSGIEVLGRGGYSERVGCIAFRNSSDNSRTLFAYSYGIDPTVECSESISRYQIVQNVLGGSLV